MERTKTGSGTRGPKSKVTQQPPDTFIALGAKQSSSRDTDSKRNVSSISKASSSHLQPSSSKGGSERKREGSSSNLQSVPPPKKIKGSIPGRAAGIGASSTAVHIQDRTGPSTVGVEPWEMLAIECEPTELFENVVACVNAGNTDKAISYILGTIKAFKGRLKPCKVLYNSILLVCQCKPALFTNEQIVNALVSSIRREITAGFKSPNKSNIYTQILFINLLLHAFNDVEHWPEALVKLYVEDALGDRVWIDNPYCKPFVDNVVTAFNTKQPPKVLLTSETWLSSGRDTSSPLTVNTLEDDDAFNEHKVIVDNWKIKICPRYAQVQEMVEKISLEAIQEQIARRQQPEAITKNFVRFLSTASGLVEIRMLAASRLESWLHNHKLMKPAQELLAYVCYNCPARTQRDIEVVAQLSKLRLKSKPLVNIFNNCLKEMVICFPENLYPLLKYTIYNELSNARNTNNLVVVGAMFQVTPEASADAFADICLELLLNKDDYLRSLRALLKEINRVLRHDFNLLSVVHALLREKPDVSHIIREFEFRERVFFALADLVCMCMLLCVSPQVRDAATQSKRDVTILQAFQNQVSNIQREAITWLHDSAIRVFRPAQTEFTHILHKVLFLVSTEEYYKVDSWPGENERSLFIRLASEVPLLQATLLRILLIGLSKEHPMGPSDVMEVLDPLVRRVANLAPDCMPPLVMDKIEIIDFFFNLCSYNYHENITMPTGYNPPKLAIASLYWKSWLILLILAAHNPTTFGSLAWNKYPTLRTLMEMCITNHFSFPPPTIMASGESIDDYSSKELQINALEKQEILEFESHLATASSNTKVEITEHNTLLLPQLMELRPKGDARKPPPNILEQLRVLNGTLRLGHLLCRSRNPDFLLDIMSRQGGTSHMPWLAELVHSSEGAFAHLPVQCLCEYLLSTIPTEKLTKHGQLLMHLRTVVNGSDPQNACEVLEYLLRRLTSIHASSRIQAIKGLTLILNPNDDTELTNINTGTQWLTQYIPLFPHLNAVRPLLVQFLRQALFVETNPTHVSNYVTFLSTQDLDETIPDLLELVLDLASIIVERSCITSHILPGDDLQILKALITVFCIYLQRARQPTDETFPWSECQDQVAVTWANGEQCTLQILIVHASIILLTYGPLENFEYFDALMDTWFPLNEEHPKAYLVDTSEEALLVPDWLKLRMIRSNVPKLVDAAVEKLEAPQLVLFIQSFGIPVISISKLLQALDKVTVLDPKLVVDSVLDKNYMIQLVEVQNRRGATGGETFVRALELQGLNLLDDEEMDISESKKPLPVLTKCEIEPKGNADVVNIPNILNNIFSMKYGGDRNKEFHALIKLISVNLKAKSVVLQHLKIVTPEFIQCLIQMPHFSTILCKILFAKKNFDENSLQVAQLLLNNISNANTPIAAILTQFINGGKIEDGNLKSIKIESSDLSKIMPKTSILTNMSETIEDLGEKLGKMLMKDDLKEEKTGLIVDWLCSVELEILNSNERNVQMDLLFSKKSLPFRPLLISLLLQRGSWSTLYGIVINLLKGNDLGYCPVSALDFLIALTQSPKLWQGRDKAIPKHYHSEDVLHLNADQVTALVNYIIEEAQIHTHNWEKNMEKRLPLLLKTIGKSAEAVVKILLSRAEVDKKCRELLLMLYMSLPSVGKYLTTFNKHQFASTVYSKTSSSIVDVISHTILSALAATSRNKDWPRKSQELELCARKLAATHPELVLRQLPMLAGSLRGRAQYEFPVLKNRGHLQLFGQILGILELLQPIIFEQCSSLCAILDCFFLLLQFHGHIKELTFILNRIVTFLQNWMTKDVKAALKYLQQHGQLLNELQLSQPSVRPLLSSVSLPTQDQNAPSELLVGTATPPVPEPLPQQWPALLTALQSQDILLGLQELDHLTNKKPQLLQHVIQYLYNSLDSSSSSIRSLALLLVIRLLRFNPKESSEALPAILMCLNNKNPDVVASILEKLPELVASMQEHAKLILTCAFRLGVHSNLNANSSIAKSIALLSLQYGC